MIFLEGRALARIVPSCGTPTRTATHSKQRSLPRVVRYGTARAASNSR
jgi:hypothetical protein